MMRKLFVSFFIPAIFISSVAHASVVMTGTRIIYSGEIKEKSIQLRNPDNQVYLVQMQVDDREDVKSGEEASSSFVVTPQIFRMEPRTGQSATLKYIGEKLPQDRESLFYLSFTQLPVMKKSEQTKNQLILAITSRVKIFYRPKGLTELPSDVAKTLTFTMNGKHVTVNNPTGYHVVIRKASLLTKGKEITLANSVMIAPKTKADWTPSLPISSLSGSLLRLTIVNDYGADAVSTIAL